MTGVQTCALPIWFGKLYSWKAISDPRGICPKGFKVPSLSDWNKLFNYLGIKISRNGKYIVSAQTSFPGFPADVIVWDF